MSWHICLSAAKHAIYYLCLEDVGIREISNVMMMRVIFAFRTWLSNQQKLALSDIEM